MSQLSAHLDRGWDLVSRGDFAGALRSAENSLELDEDSPEAHNLLGYIYAAEGRPEDALEHYRTALELDESFVEAMLNAAEVLLHPLRRFDEALRSVDEALDWVEEDGELAECLLLRADIQLAMGNPAGAKATMKRLPAGPYEDPQQLLQIGRVRLDVGDLDGAQASLEAAIAKEAPGGEAHYALGRLYDVRQDPKAALIAFLQARERDLMSPRPPWAMATEHFEPLVRNALGRLPKEIAEPLEGALVVVTDCPGAEVVADGVDPRALVLAEAPSLFPEPFRIGRLFVYQRNIERMAAGLLEIEEEIRRGIGEEVAALRQEWVRRGKAPVT